jgi:hypothetical protein
MKIDVTLMWCERSAKLKEDVRKTFKMWMNDVECPQRRIAKKKLRWEVSNLIKLKNDDRKYLRSRFHGEKLIDYLTVMCSGGAADAVGG